MVHRQLGGSELRISRIGFGCMSLAKAGGAAESLIHRAVDAGINFFDTADLYDRGQNEELLGKALGNRRKDVLLATKVGNQWRADGSGWDWNPTPGYITAAVEESLRRLRTDCIDLYQLHGGTMEDPIEETIGAFDKLVRHGRIRYYGISSIRPKVIETWVGKSHMSSVMMQYSLLDRRPERTCLPLLLEHGIGVLARGTVAQGLLVDKPAKPYLDRNGEEVSAARSAIEGLAGPGIKQSTIAIGFALHHPAITAAIVGMHTEKQLDEALKAAELALSEEQLKQLTDAVRQNDY